VTNKSANRRRGTATSFVDLKIGWAGEDRMTRSYVRDRRTELAPLICYWAWVAAALRR